MAQVLCLGQSRHFLTRINTNISSISIQQFSKTYPGWGPSSWPDSRWRQTQKPVNTDEQELKEKLPELQAVTQMSYPAVCAQSSWEQSSRDWEREGMLLKPMIMGITHGTFYSNCI